MTHVYSIQLPAGEVAGPWMSQCSSVCDWFALYCAMLYLQCCVSCICSMWAAPSIQDDTDAEEDEEEKEEEPGAELTTTTTTCHQRSPTTKVAWPHHHRLLQAVISGDACTLAVQDCSFLALGGRQGSGTVPTGLQEGGAALKAAQNGCVCFACIERCIYETALESLVYTCVCKFALCMTPYVCSILVI